MRIVIWYVRKEHKQNDANRLMTMVAGFPVVLGAGIGIADALQPFKMIIAEASDPICFIGGSLGLYRIGIGDRENGFKQVLNAALAQAGFFLWPKIQLAIRSGMGG